MERNINPLFNVHEKYNDVHIINPYRFRTEGLKTKSLSFDGSNDYVNCGNDESLRITNNLTVEYWLYILGYASNRIICGRWNTSTKRIWDNVINDTEVTYQFQINITNNGIISASTGKSYIISKTHAEGYPVSINAWNHIAFTFASNVLKLYVNGSEVIEPTLVKYHDAEVNTLFDADTSMAIGCYNADSTPAGFSNIKIDDLRIWDKVKTQAEIQNEMNIQLIGNEANLVAYYNMNEGSGSALYDRTSNGNNGSISGASWSEE